MTEFCSAIRTRRENFLSRIVTADKTWISLYEPESKEQSTMWKTLESPSPKKFKVSHSTKKQMFIMFFDIHGVILSHAVPQVQTVTANYYSKVSIHWLKGVESAFHSKGSTLKRTNAFRQKFRKGM